jgi:hypothetical protein
VTFAERKKGISASVVTWAWSLTNLFFFFRLAFLTSNHLPYFLVERPVESHVELHFVLCWACIIRAAISLISSSRYLSGTSLQCSWTVLYPGRCLIPQTSLYSLLEARKE